MPCSRLRSIFPSRTRRSSRARVLRVSRARISRETAVQDIHYIFKLLHKAEARLMVSVGFTHVRKVPRHE
jgi:hypothetical protein